MSASTSAAVRDQQRAFVGLLGTPLLTPAVDPVLHRLVMRHLPAVTDSARRLGYRVQRLARAVRLIRVPVAGTVTFPPKPADAPSRRLLSLVCCLAACCEDVTGTVTLQRLSDMVRDLTAAPGTPIGVYDPDERSHRRQLRDAARVLETFTVLRRRTADESMMDDWTDTGAGPGAGYAIDRDALLLLTSQDVLHTALSRDEVTTEQYTATRTLRHLRALAETPAVLYADLHPADADALRISRGLRAADLAQMTGGHVEARTEGLLLVLVDEERSDTVEDWPRARAADWVALLAADLAGRVGTRQSDGSVYLSPEQVDDVIDELKQRRGEYMSKTQRTVPAAVRDDAQARLRELGLLRTADDGSWTLLAIAGRYRDPAVTTPDNTETTT